MQLSIKLDKLLSVSDSLQVRLVTRSLGVEFCQEFWWPSTAGASRCIELVEDLHVFTNSRSTWESSNASIPSLPTLSSTPRFLSLLTFSQNAILPSRLADRTVV
jgi:hypothetical protein